MSCVQFIPNHKIIKRSKTNRAITLKKKSVFRRIIIFKVKKMICAYPGQVREVLIEIKIITIVQDKKYRTFYTILQTKKTS